MLSQSSALAIAKTYSAVFTDRSGWGNDNFRREALHDILFERGFPAWVYGKAKSLFTPREAEEWILHFHTGQSAYPAMKDATGEERQAAGQLILRQLAEAILNLYHDGSAGSELTIRFAPIFGTLLRRLQFDGYTYRFPRLLAPESDVLDTHEETGVLNDLYNRLALAQQDVARHCLKLSEEHWLNGRWDDCIGNARKFLEAVLREVAAAHSLRKMGTALPEKTYASPELVRQYLRAEGLLELKEQEAVRVVYGLLSNTGNHPYIAGQDQARLLRQQALIFAQFIMLRYQGYLAANP
jgi:hypothetical protein